MHSCINVIKNRTNGRNNQCVLIETCRSSVTPLPNAMEEDDYSPRPQSKKRQRNRIASLSKKATMACCFCQGPVSVGGTLVRQNGVKIFIGEVETSFTPLVPLHSASKACGDCATVSALNITCVVRTPSTTHQSLCCSYDNVNIISSIKSYQQHTFIKIFLQQRGSDIACVACAVAPSSPVLKAATTS